MEKVYENKVQVVNANADCFGRLSPTAILELAQEAATAHCKVLALDWETLKEKNLFWAVIRHKVEINRLPLIGETVTVETWPMPTTKVAYPRATAAYDEQGRELFRMVSLWVLMDRDSRAMVLPGKSGVLVDGFLRGTELELPSNLPARQACGSVSRQVRFSDLDRNLHMNNTRYLNWVTDLLPSPFHKSHPVKGITLCYLSELREGQQADLRWQLSDTGTLYVTAHRPPEQTDNPNQRIFSCALEF